MKKDMKILTAFFSHKGENYFGGRIVYINKGNTAKVAEKLHALVGGDMYEIKSASPYPETYKETVAAAVAELSAGIRPELAAPVPDVSEYDAVILAYPNWCGTAPMAVRTFLESADFSGKRILPVCTHEGSGAGRSEADISASAPGAVVARPLAVVGSEAAHSDELLVTYLKERGVLGV